MKIVPVKHLKKGRKFGRQRSQRKALMKSLASSIFIFGKVKTTEAKAKEVRSLVERSLHQAKYPSLTVRRSLGGFYSQPVVKKLLETAGSLGERNGGYTRITKLGPRRGDGAKMVILELLK